MDSYSKANEEPLRGSEAPVSIIWEEAEAQGSSLPGIRMLKDQEVLLWAVSAAWLIRFRKGFPAGAFSH